MVGHTMIVICTGTDAGVCGDVKRKNKTVLRLAFGMSHLNVCISNIYYSNIRHFK